MAIFGRDRPALLTLADKLLDTSRHSERGLAMGRALHRRVVPETYVQLLYEYLDARGHSPETVLGAAWPQPDPQGRGGVEVQRWEQMLERAAAWLDDPLIGLHLGQTITARHLGVLGAVALACENLGAAFLRLQRYQRLIYDVNPMITRTGAGWIDVLWDISQGRAGRLNEHTGYTVLAQFARDLVRSPIDPMLVRFAGAAPADARPFEAYFGCPVLFDQPEAGLRFSLEMLALPLKSPDAALIALLEQHADRLLAALPQQEEIVERVRKAMVQVLRDGEPDIAAISAALHCSPRTLQRHLAQAGTSFRGELNLVRHELAAAYLRDRRLQIADIALLLGYSEHSAFTRAYREWTGMSPQQARASALAP